GNELGRRRPPPAHKAQVFRHLVERRGRAVGHEKNRGFHVMLSLLASRFSLLASRFLLLDSQAKLRPNRESRVASREWRAASSVVIPIIAASVDVRIGQRPARARPELSAECRARG